MEQCLFILVHAFHDIPRNAVEFKNRVYHGRGGAMGVRRCDGRGDRGRAGQGVRATEDGSGLVRLRDNPLSILPSWAPKNIILDSFFEETNKRFFFVKLIEKYNELLTTG